MSLLRASRSNPLLTVPAALFVLIGACVKAPTAPSSYAVFSQTDLRVGDGAMAALGNTVGVHYTGWLYDGSKPNKKGLQFETSVGGAPFTFILGEGSVINGWEQGVPGMNVGGLRRLVVPPSLAYGAYRRGTIPPNATLVFEIELLEVK